MMQLGRTPETATVYTIGRSGHDVSTYCVDLDALESFSRLLQPGNYWIRRSVIRMCKGGYRNPLREVDWGTIEVTSTGGTIFRILPYVSQSSSETDFRDAWQHSALPGPGRD